MRTVYPSFVIETPEDEIFRSAQILEKIGRTCYKSEDKITADSAEIFVAMLARREHWAMLEHRSISVRFICDRGVSHEIVRHRLASFAQESTRYCDYAKGKFNGEITYIDIDRVMLAEVGKTYDGQVITVDTVGQWLYIWVDTMQYIEKQYLAMREKHCPAQLARSVLPNSLKTEIVVTMNLREWHHFFTLRTADAAHPQMRELTIPLLMYFRRWLPQLFWNIPIPEVENEGSDN